ncbi:membrane glycosyltransferase [Arboricoccus pini]|uniref:Glucans biosynthesis glucosyltransferase H n=1 Tax=Arboricoccus pini TaxID=1963835 RepID=A0A212Q5Q5_9PROT|nr:glucans biosynthesis glucosyltransferase MdoH [Arboricoccus pini]SNB54670.1 membrane glycosyltransferase [Arboricoccus pini]
MGAPEEVLLDDRQALRWMAAEERVMAYLLAAGLDAATAGDAASAVIERLALSHKPETAEEAILLALAEIRRVLAEVPVSSDCSLGSLLPHALPLAVRRQSLSPALQWRQGRWLPRPVAFKAEMRERLEQERTRVQPRAKLPARARRRRAIFAILGLLTAAWCVSLFVQILAINGLTILDIVHSVIFTILVLWLSQSFWTLSAGFGVRLWRLLRAPRVAPPGSFVPSPDVRGRAALVMPIYNEGTERVFDGLKAMWTDMRREAPDDRRFDLFILSDTTDPDVWLAEVEAWRRLRLEVGDMDRIFYRRRDRNVGRKAGNIEDFVTRFGGTYEYMVVLDADSIMTGKSIFDLVQRMDDNPTVGLIQAPPKLVRGKTLFARVLQSAGELYGPLAAGGTAYWAAGEGNYWGHNAIIRTRPFSELCGLPQLPGKAPFGGQILSHDFVEAALIRRGGWQVWIADDLPGSYEEPPPTIEDFAVRDRRWCQGNMQHVQILFARRLHWVSRFHFAIGIMSYLTSPLWLIFLILSAMQAWEITHTTPLYFAEDWPFPLLPVSVQAEASLLITVTLGLLFLPKVMGIVLALLDPPRRRALGGGLRIVASSLIETLYSAALAPVMMLLHTRFVVSILSGAAIDWTPQRRAAGQSQLGATIRTFFWVMAVGILTAIGVWFATPILFYWLLPVTLGMVLVVPLALMGASEGIGQALRRRGLLLVSEETEEPLVMRALDEAESGEHPDPGSPIERMTRVVLEPAANALHVQLQRAYGSHTARNGQDRWLLERKAIFVGPMSLDKTERRALLEDADLMERLHVMAWLHWPGYLPGVLEDLERSRLTSAKRLG